MGKEISKIEKEFTCSLPNGWSIVKLGDYGSFSKGKGITKKELVAEGIPCIRYGEIYTTESYVINQFHSFIDEIKGTKLKDGDVLFAGSGETIEEIGKAISFIGKKEAYAGGDIIIFSPNTKQCDSIFLAHFLGTSIVRKQKRKLGQGNSVVHIYSKGLACLNIILPSLSEQKVIAKTLITWDKNIQTLQTLIDQKQLQKKWLMQQLLTGKKRLPGFDGAWEKTSAGDIFKSVSTKNHPNEELLSVTQDRGVIPRNMLKGRVTMPTGKRDGFKLVEKGNFVISLRSFQGGLEYSYYRGLVSPAYTILKPKEEVDDTFYKYYFKSYDFIGHLSIAVVGIRDGKQISYTDFCTVKIPDISLEEQKAIAEVLAKADEEIKLLEQKLIELKEQKKGLMQQLLTGKKRLV